MPKHRLLQKSSDHASLATNAQDEDRLKRAVNTVPTHAELNAMLARSEQERLIFDHLDRTLAWPEPAGKRNPPAGDLPNSNLPLRQGGLPADQADASGTRLQG